MSKDPRIGKTISHYKVLSALGRGGMGLVYKAEDTKLKRPVALKFMPANMLLDAQSKERFMREGQAASKLDHPRIGTIYQIDETEDGELFIAMAFYDGATLKEKIEEGTFNVEASLGMARQIANGLKAAHDNGVIHRDIKPANIILTKDGFAKIVDFGLAKLGDITNITQPGTSMGTPGYMSPEQAKGTEVDHRCDVWAICVILYEMLTGSLPFKGTDKMSMLYNIVNEAPTPVDQHNKDLPPEFDQIFQKAFDKNIEKRYQSSQELLDDLDAIEIARTPSSDDIKTVILQPEKQIPPQAGRQSAKKSIWPKVTAFAVVAVLAAVIGLNYTNQASDSLAENPGGEATKAGELALMAQNTDSVAPTGESISKPENKNIAEVKETAVEPVSRDKEGPGETKPKNRDDLPVNSKPPVRKPNAASKRPAKQAPKLASLIISSDPPGATIYLGDSLSSRQTPFTFAKLKAGTYGVRVSKEGFQDESARIDLAPGSERSTHLTLKQEPQSVLSVSAVTQTGGAESIAFAEIFVDGKSFGQTPRSFPLRGGKYTIEAKLFGYPTEEKKVVLKDGIAQSLKFEFTKD